MAPVHLYLAAWVAGGVLLGASMLLDGRDSEVEDNPFASPDAFGERAPVSSDGIALPSAAPLSVISSRSLQQSRRLRFLVRVRSLLPIGLVGFGLSGLTAKGLDLDSWPWSFLCALSVGLSLVGLGYRLSRPRTP